MCAVIATSSTSFATPVHVSFSATSNHFISLFSDGRLELWSWELPLPTATGSAKAGIAEPVRARTFHAIGPKEKGYAIQCAIKVVATGLQIAVLVKAAVGDRIALIDGEGEVLSVPASEDVRKLLATAVGADGFILQTSTGALLSGASYPSRARSLTRV